MKKKISKSEEKIDKSTETTHPILNDTVLNIVGAEQQQTLNKSFATAKSIALEAYRNCWERGGDQVKQLIGQELPIKMYQLFKVFLMKQKNKHALASEFLPKIVPDLLRILREEPLESQEILNYFIDQIPEDPELLVLEDKTGTFDDFVFDFALKPHNHQENEEIIQKPLPVQFSIRVKKDKIDLKIQLHETLTSEHHGLLIAQKEISRNATITHYHHIRESNPTRENESELRHEVVLESVIESQKVSQNWEMRESDIGVYKAIYFRLDTFEESNLKSDVTFRLSNHNIRPGRYCVCLYPSQPENNPQLEERWDFDAGFAPILFEQESPTNLLDSVISEKSFLTRLNFNNGQLSSFLFLDAEGEDHRNPEEGPSRGTMVDHSIKCEYCIHGVNITESVQERKKINETIVEGEAQDATTLVRRVKRKL